MAEELKRAFGVETEFITGSEGSFDVIVDGETIFSKSETGRFPEPGEIRKLIKAKLVTSSQRRK